NIMSFVASISTMIAPITTMAASLLPLLIPLMPLMGALGGLAIMVGRHISGLANSIKEVEPLQRRLNFLGGSPAGGDREMKYAQGVTNKLNVPVKEGIDAYSQLAIAARGTKLEGDGVKSLFEGISAFFKCARNYRTRCFVSLHGIYPIFCNWYIVNVGIS
ncbi:MAG: hypothetical protein ACKPJF_29270, partial [Dolichospermum sp.]